MVEAAITHPSFIDGGSDVSFVSRNSLPPSTSPGDVFLSEEDHSFASSVCSLHVSRHPEVPIPRWHCQNADTAWLGPDPEEFRRILDGKKKKAEKYALDGAALWLLIVCGILGNLQSYIIPANDTDRSRLAEAVQQCGFDFSIGTFEQVWDVRAGVDGFGGRRWLL